MDVKTAFLNEIVEEDVYMLCPGSFVDHQEAGKVFKLQKSIYGVSFLDLEYAFR